MAYIITAIRKNIPGKPDYIWIGEHPNGRTQTFSTEALADMALSAAMVAHHSMYGGKVVHIPDA